MTGLDRAEPIVWRKSSFSVSGECVEVARSGPEIVVRDSKNRDGQPLSFPSFAWQAFLVRLKATPPAS
jgi:uncharacterized protein DUF397